MKKKLDGIAKTERSVVVMCEVSSETRREKQGK
jgi:hypothetical protein